MLSTSDRKLYERFLENRDDFSLISNTDPAARRDTKIARFKKENELKLKLEVSQASHIGAGHLTPMPVSQQCPIRASRRRCSPPRNIPC